MSTKPLKKAVLIFIAPILLAIAFGFYSIQSKQTIPHHVTQNEINMDYWNEGLAEVSRYSLTQNRYQDVHPGEVVTIFVKEDFLTDKQVKNESYTSNKSTPVLKNITTKKFTTGLYDYTMATSTFSPFDQKSFPGALKVQSTSTEWCGTSYVQLNDRRTSYAVELRSYFEKEGDQNYAIEHVLLEDELLNLIRFDPKLLPTGKVKIVPLASYSRLTHVRMDGIDAIGSQTRYDGKDFKGKEVEVYQIQFPELKRTKRIYYEARYPHVILGWDDTYPSMFDKQLRSTKARLTHQVRQAYWNQNKASDAPDRKSLGLHTYEEN